MRVFITVDTEQDCPPFRSTYQGITEGIPKLIHLFDEKKIKGTFFTTGDVAKRYPEVIKKIVEKGHEIGCHGLTHERFDKINSASAEHAIKEASKILREFYPVSSFRAPCLQFPEEFLKFLIDENYRIDSSKAKHKSLFVKTTKTGSLLRIPVSTTSLTIRLPKIIRNILLNMLKDPVVLFVHPWEYVDLRNEKLRFDCRYNTGHKALEALSQTLDLFKAKGAGFHKMEDFTCGDNRKGIRKG